MSSKFSLRPQFQQLLQFKRDVRGEAQEYRIGGGDSLFECLVVPTVGPLRRPSGPAIRLVLQTLRTEEVTNEKEISHGRVMCQLH